MENKPPPVTLLYLRYPFPPLGALAAPARARKWKAAAKQDIGELEKLFGQDMRDTPGKPLDL